MHADLTAVTMQPTKQFQMKLKTTKGYESHLTEKKKKLFGQPSISLAHPRGNLHTVSYMPMCSLSLPGCSLAAEMHQTWCATGRRARRSMPQDHFT